MGHYTNPLMDVLAILSIAACLFTVSSGLAGYFIRTGNWVERGMMILAAIGFLGFSFTYNFGYVIGALILVAVVILWQLARRENPERSI